MIPLTIAAEASCGGEPTLGSPTWIYDVDLGIIEKGLKLVPELLDHFVLVSVVKTCCVNASKAKDKIVKLAPKETRYLQQQSMLRSSETAQIVLTLT